MRARISMTAFSGTPRLWAMSFDCASCPSRSRRWHSRLRLKNSLRWVKVVATLIIRELAIRYW
jgi:hypothetical protein